MSTFESIENTDSAGSIRRHPVAEFFLAPFQWRTYANWLYLWLAFPLGLFYFVALTVGFSLSVGLLIIWIGVLTLLLTLLLVWTLGGLERGLATTLLGAEIPQRTLPSVGEVGILRWLGAMLRNPSLYKSIVFLGLKFPLGLSCWMASVVDWAFPRVHRSPWAFWFGNGDRPRILVGRQRGGHDSAGGSRRGAAARDPQSAECGGLDFPAPLGVAARIRGDLACGAELGPACARERPGRTDAGLKSLEVAAMRGGLFCVVEKRLTDHRQAPARELFGQLGPPVDERASHQGFDRPASDQDLRSHPELFGTLASGFPEPPLEFAARRCGERRGRCNGKVRGRELQSLANDLQETLAVTLGLPRIQILHPRQILGVLRLLLRQRDERVVLDHEAARDVTSPGLGVPPRREGAQHSQLRRRQPSRGAQSAIGLERPLLEPFGVEDLGRVLERPLETAELFETLAQDSMGREEARHVLHRIGQLLRRERPRQPVGTCLAFEDLDAEHREDQLLVAQGGREACQAGGDLGVEQRRRDGTDSAPEHFHVFARRVQHLENARRAQDLAERRQVLDAQRIDEKRRATIAHLHQTEAREKRAFAHELGVESEDFGLLPLFGGCFQRRAAADVNDRKIGEGLDRQRRSDDWCGVRRLAQGVAPEAAR